MIKNRLFATTPKYYDVYILLYSVQMYSVNIESLESDFGAKVNGIFQDYSLFPPYLSILSTNIILNPISMDATAKIVTTVVTVTNLSSLPAKNLFIFCRFMFSDA